MVHSHNLHKYKRFFKTLLDVILLVLPSFALDIMRNFGTLLAFRQVPIEYIVSSSTKRLPASGIEVHKLSTKTK